MAEEFTTTTVHSRWDLQISPVSDKENENSSTISLGFDDILNSNLPIPPPPGFLDTNNTTPKLQDSDNALEFELNNIESQPWSNYESIYTEHEVNDVHQYHPQQYIPFEHAESMTIPVFSPLLQDYYQGNFKVRPEYQPSSCSSFFGLIDSLDGMGSNFVNWQTYERATNEIWNMRNSIRSRSATDLLDNSSCTLGQDISSCYEIQKCNYLYDASGEEAEEGLEEEDRAGVGESSDATGKIIVHTTESSDSSTMSLRVLMSQQTTAGNVSNGNETSKMKTKVGRYEGCCCYECRWRWRNRGISSSQSLTDLDHEINYIRKNILDLKKYKKPAPLEPKAIVVTQKGDKKPPLPRLAGGKGFGKVPDYLIKRKEEIIKAKETAALEAAQMARIQAEARRKERKQRIEAAKYAKLKEEQKRNRLNKYLNVALDAIKNDLQQMSPSRLSTNVFISRYKSPPDLRLHPEISKDILKLTGPKEKQNPNNNNIPSPKTNKNKVSIPKISNEVVVMWMDKKRDNSTHTNPSENLMSIVLKKEEMSDSEIFSNLPTPDQLRKGLLSAPGQGYSPIVTTQSEDELKHIKNVPSVPISNPQLPDENE